MYPFFNFHEIRFMREMKSIQLKLGVYSLEIEKLKGPVKLSGYILMQPKRAEAGGDCIIGGKSAGTYALAHWGPVPFY